MPHHSFGNRLRAISIVFILLAAAIIVRLFILQIIQHDYYATFAMSTHEIYKKLHARRGQIFFQDRRSRQEYPAAVNRQYYNVYAVPKEIPPEEVANAVNRLSEVLKYSEEEKSLLQKKISKGDDPYEPIAKKLTDEAAEEIRNQALKGVYVVGSDYRYYPEGNLAAQVLGFYGLDKNGNPAGLYGIEGYWEKVLAGKSGFVAGEKGAGGGLIVLAGRTTRQAEDGADILLTIDRAVQYKACESLRDGWKEFQAKSASLVMMDPKTGAIIAMCSLPEFNPNEYSKAESLNAYNNSAIFTPYEPGSVFKPIGMAGAVDANLVGPQTTWQDPCERRIEGFTIHNAQNKCYGEATMTRVLEDSINTGMIWVEEQLGRQRFKEYVEKFGFGIKTGVALDTETAGDISSLEKKGQIYGAVAAFGQGIMVTPLQLAVAYSALANGGQMLKPYIVQEARYADGRRDKTEPQAVAQIISPRAAKLMVGMLVSVVENGHAQRAKMKEYYVAGKTGTAQIPGRGGYSEDTNHTFAGYAPASDPKFVLVVKFEAPKRQWAESTAAPVFKDIAEFTLKYYGVKGDR